MNSEIRYIELKSGHRDKGPAWIGRVQISRSGRTMYFNGMALKAIKGGGVGSNYYDLESNQQYWVSGIKKDSSNRHWAGSGKIMIEKSLVSWFESIVSYKTDGLLQVIDDLPDTDIERLHLLENGQINQDL